MFIFQALKGHDDHVITCLEFYGTRIVSGSDDNTLKVWSAITGKVSRSTNAWVKVFRIIPEFKILSLTFH